MANPIISRTEMAIGGRAMTVNGTIKKTSMLIATSAVTALMLVWYIFNTNSFGLARILGIAGALSSFALAMVIMFKPQLAKALAFPYAICEGLFIAGISFFAMNIDKTIPMSAVSATFVISATMLALYRSGLIKVTAKFRSIIMSATIAIMILYAIQFVMSLAFGSSIPLLFEGGIIAIGFCIFALIIAAFNLLLDFDNIENGVAMGISEEYEWVYSVGVLATLVWMYFELVRLLGYLND